MECIRHLIFRTSLAILAAMEKIYMNFLYINGLQIKFEVLLPISERVVPESAKLVLIRHKYT